MKKRLLSACVLMSLMACLLLSVTASAETMTRDELNAATGIELTLHQSILDGRSGDVLHVYPGDRLLYVVTAENRRDTVFENAVLQLPVSILETSGAVPMGDYELRGNYIEIGDIAPGETVVRGFLLTVPENAGSVSYGSCVVLAGLKTAGKFNVLADVRERAVSNSVNIQIGDPDLRVHVKDDHVRITNRSSSGGASKIVLEFPLDKRVDVSALPDNFSVRNQKLVVEAGALAPNGACEFDLPYAAIPDRVTYATGDVENIRLPMEAVTHD